MEIIWCRRGEYFNLIHKIYAYLPPENKNKLCDSRKYPLNVCSDPEYGLSIGRTSFKFATGVWNRLALHIQVNTPGQSDGFIQFYLNGEKVMEDLDIVFRGAVSSDSLLVSDIFFSTFFGGSTLAYGAPSDTFTCFKNINFSVSNTRLELGTAPTSDGLSLKEYTVIAGLISIILSVILTL